jgi:hypothetical protein
MEEDLMEFLSDLEQAALRIDKFIFHVVHHGADEPILLDEVPLGEFEDFFLDRIKDTLKGNRFHFLNDTATFMALQRTNGNPDEFVSCSKELARDFHSRHDRRIKPGVLIVMMLSAGEKKLFSLIKYDHEQVLTYHMEGSTRAILTEITNSFTKSKDSLHKSALIRLNGDSGDVIVIDRTVRHDITEFFRGFLNVRRQYTPKQMTEIAHQAAIDTMKAHQSELPHDVTSKIRSLSYQAIQNNEIYEESSFFDKVFGPHGTEEMRKTFGTIARKKNLDGESFRFEKDAVKPPRDRKFKTKEGVRIQYGEDAEDTVKMIKDENTGETLITITTQQIIEM